jgi:hypothetical protein
VDCFKKRHTRVNLWVTRRREQHCLLWRKSTHIVVQV